MPQIPRATVRPIAALFAMMAALAAAASFHTASAQAAPAAAPAEATASADTTPKGLLTPEATPAAGAKAVPNGKATAAPAETVEYDQNGYPQRPQGPVLDAADILDPAAEAALAMRLREYNARTGRALVVATVRSLNDDSIEMYAVRLFEKWGIGGAQTDQGLLLLVAPNERQVRIEVGYGLHQYVTDILSGRIIRGEITPAFQRGDYAGGINAGVNALITQLDRDPADARAVAEAAEASAKAGGRSQEGATIGGVIFWIVMIVFFISLFGRGSGGSRRRYGAAGAVGDIILWHAIGSAMGGNSDNDGGFGGGGFGGGGGGFGGFGGGMSGGGGASGSW